MTEKFATSFAYRRSKLKTRFDRLGRGARARCSWAIHIAPATISRLLTGKYKSWPTLEKMEQWIHEQEENSNL